MFASTRGMPVAPFAQRSKSSGSRVHTRGRPLVPVSKKMPLPCLRAKNLLGVGVGAGGRGFSHAWRQPLARSYCQGAVRAAEQKQCAAPPHLKKSRQVSSKMTQ